MEKMKLNIQLFGAYYSNWSLNYNDSYNFSSAAVRLKIVSSYTQNASAKTSTVTIKEYIETDGVETQYTATTENHSLTHTGTTVYNYNEFEHPGVSGGTQTTLIKQYTKTISHNPTTGEASYSLSGNCDYWVFDGNGNGSSGTLSITTKTISLPAFSLNVNMATELHDVGPDYVKVRYIAYSSYDTPQIRLWNAGAWGQWRTAVGNPVLLNRKDNNTYLNPSVNGYGVQMRFRNPDNGLWTECNPLYFNTLSNNYLTQYTDFTLGNNTFDIYFYNPKQYRTKIYIKDKNGIVLGERDNITTETYQLVLSNEEVDGICNTNPDTIFATYSIDVETYNPDGSKVGNTQNKSSTCTIVNANPTFTNFEYEDINPVTLDLTGNNKKIIKGYSNVKAIISTTNKATAQKGATMSKYRFVCGEKQIDVNYSDIAAVELLLNAIDNNVFVVYAIDSRGNSTMKQISPSTYFAYTKLKLNPIAVSRLTPIDTHTKLSFSGSFFNTNFGSKSNTLTAEYYYRESDSATWITGTTPLTIIKNEGTYSFEGEIAGDLEALGFSIDNSYLIGVYVNDLLSDYTIYDDEILSSGKPNNAWHKNGNAFGMPFDETIGESVQFGRPIYVKIDGELVPLLQKHIMTASTSGRPKITESIAYDEVKIPLDTVVSIGTKLTFDNINDRIIIGTGVSKVMVSGIVNLYDPPNFWDTSVGVCKNGIKVINCLDNAMGRIEVPFPLPQRLVSVSAGDYFEIKFASQTTGDYTILSDGDGSYLTVEVIE